MSGTQARIFCCWMLWILYWLFPLVGFATDPDVIFSAMEAELHRTMEGLRSEQYPPYFLSYAITDQTTYYVSGSFGVLAESSVRHERVLDIDIRVGDYHLDNTHPIRGQALGAAAIRRGYALPIEDDAKALRKALWLYTDRQYKEAVERYMKVLGNVAVKVAEEDTSGDFSREEPLEFAEPLKTLQFSQHAWEQKVRELSALFLEDSLLFRGEVSVSGIVRHRFFINSEGTRVQRSQAYIRLVVVAKAKAEDGMVLPLYQTYFAFREDELPPVDSIRKDIRRMIRLLRQLRTAPEMESYAGPAILAGKAAGVFFHEILGHRIEGHRLKDVRYTRTFKDLLGKKILPEFLSVVFEPNRRWIRGQALAGSYPVDDEGVRAQRVVAVDHGIFRNFLMSRIPIEGFPHSNGHGRAQPGLSPVARQSNLIVEADKTVPRDSLRRLLIQMCKQEGLEYGLLFEEVQGGFTFTQRSIPNAFNVQPLVVYKVYVDGRPDELVRGVDIIGTPLTTFRFIVAAADDLGVFNGICGAESGNVPVSAVAPSLLISRIEVQQRQKSQAKLPLLPPPPKEALMQE